MQQRKAAKTDDEAQMWKSWLREGTAAVDREQWETEGSELSGTMSSAGLKYMADNIL